MCGPTQMNVFETVIEMVVHSHPGLQLTLEMGKVDVRPPDFALLGESFYMDVLMLTEKSPSIQKSQGKNLLGQR